MDEQARPTFTRRVAPWRAWRRTRHSSGDEGLCPRLPPRKSLVQRMAGVGLATGPAEVRVALTHLAAAARRLSPHFGMRFWRTVLDGWVKSARTHSDQGV